MIPVAVLLALVIGFFAPIHAIHPEFQPYVNDYLVIVQRFCKPDQLNYSGKTQMRFTNDFMDNQQVGQCQRYNNGSWEILVKRAEWDRIALNVQRDLIYHELSHCILLKDHVADRNNYMYPSVIDIEQDILTEQVLEDAWNLCGKK